jgi:hypothetical protein
LGVEAHSLELSACADPTYFVIADCI